MPISWPRRVPPASTSRAPRKRRWRRRSPPTSARRSGPNYAKRRLSSMPLSPSTDRLSATGRTRMGRITTKWTTMQHELFVNPAARLRRSYPFVVILQANVADGRHRIVAPLVLRTGKVGDVVNRALPRVAHDGRDFLVFLPLLGSLE